VGEGLVPVSILVGDDAAPIVRQHFVAIQFERVLEVGQRLVSHPVFQVKEAARSVVFRFGRQRLDGFVHAENRFVKAALDEGVERLLVVFVGFKAGEAQSLSQTCHVLIAFTLQNLHEFFTKYSFIRLSPAL
jgi:hypothetical protein